MPLPNHRDVRVLVACEESGAVRQAFRDKGFDAWSNDIDHCSDGSPYHIQGDCLEVMGDGWDLIVMHPPCDFLTVAGNRWYGFGTSGFETRLEYVNWTLKAWDIACHSSDHVAMENPVGILPMKPTQYVQPYEYGHPEQKKTGLWLHNLPPLVPTDILDLPEKGTPEHLEWQKVWRMAPSSERKRLRSKTYSGIAKAMADQWGEFILKPEPGHKSHQLRII